MNLLLRRFKETIEFHYGILSEIARDSKLKFTLENGIGSKHIAQGTYEIKFREVESKLTIAYRRRFKWFDWHLEVQQVPDGEYVYLHVGNDADDTDLCVLVANTCDLTPATSMGFVGESVDAFKELYLRVSEKLNSNERVFITIIDI